MMDLLSQFVNFLGHQWNTSLATVTDPWWIALLILFTFLGAILQPFEMDWKGDLKINNTKAIVFVITCFIIGPYISQSMFLSHW